MSPVLFFVPIVALVYASVGLGGGSSYTAVLLLAGLEPLSITVLALMMNIVVASVAFRRFQRESQLSLRFLIEVQLPAVPFAILGASLPVHRQYFNLIFGFALIAAGLITFVQARKQISVRKLPRFQIAAISSAVGLLAGFTGIGGGIYLGPILHATKYGNAKSIASLTASYILLNSIAGLIAKVLAHREDLVHHRELLWMAPVLCGVVMVFGYLGARWGGNLPNAKLKMFLGWLILAVGVRIVFL